jgi:hypothetical protein
VFFSKLLRLSGPQVVTVLTSSRFSPPA